VLTARTYGRFMRAEDIAEDLPVVGIDSDAFDAATLLAEHGVPGLVVTDKKGKPKAVLPAAAVVQFILPPYVLDNPSLAGVLNESAADRAVDNLSGKTVRDVLSEHLLEIPSVDASDTIVKVAMMMTKTKRPMIAVTKGKTLCGVITASRLLAAALKR
jgi:CBS domain-containing protein